MTATVGLNTYIESQRFVTDRPLWNLIWRICGSKTRLQL